MHYVGTRVVLNYLEWHFPLEITSNKCSIWEHKGWKFTETFEVNRLLPKLTGELSANSWTACCVTGLSMCGFTSSWDNNWKTPTYPTLSQKVARSVLKAMRSLGTASVRFLVCCEDKSSGLGKRGWFFLGYRNVPSRIIFRSKRRWSTQQILSRGA